MDADIRFWKKLKVIDGCWLWQGRKSWGGYGQFWFVDREIGAHRYSYLRYVGIIPEGLELDHLCRNRACVNPDHLEAVTRKENIRRGLTGHYVRIQNRYKSHCKNGHKMTPENSYISPSEAKKGWNGKHCKICISNYAKHSYEQRKSREK